MLTTNFLGSLQDEVPKPSEIEDDLDVRDADGEQPADEEAGED